MQRFSTALTALLVALMMSTAPAAAITNGTSDDEGAFPYVGIVEGAGICSGTMISPTVMLTAGHCTTGMVEVWVTFVLEIDSFEEIDIVGTPYTHPNFCQGCAPGLAGTAQYDVGIVVFEVPPLNLGWYPSPAAVGTVDTLANGTSLTAVGYGVQEFQRGGGPPQGAGLGVRNYGSVSFINNNHNLAGTFLKHSSIPGQGGGGVCSGDSGGPILSNNEIVAVISFNNWTCNSSSYAQRVDIPEVRNWIMGFL